MAHFLPPEHVRQVNKLEWPKMDLLSNPDYISVGTMAPHIVKRGQ